ncbi:MAG: MerR family DNA-binding transcriptional regulator [Acidobacteria bacterium]|nr:MerR family DNA-binding transcriptional regulator [Acidobacteriota bacterium]
MSDRAFLSIGEVLELLKEEFPDITISKIRFLESQGLLDPERTPSGYRKFYDPDVERLRWILQQQREHFLPLKVIKERILSPEAEVPVSSPEPEVPSPGGSSAAPTVESPERQSRPASGSALPGSSSPLSAGLSGVSMTMLELASAAGVEVSTLQELERYGLMAGRPMAGTTYYDEESLVVARLAAGMARHGVEARHLRMYKTSAEREASTYEQVILPLLKQRNPAARRQAVDTLEDLARLGEGLHSAFVRAALRNYADS